MHDHLACLELFTPLQEEPQTHLLPGNLQKTHLGLRAGDTLTTGTMPRPTVPDRRDRWVGGPVHLLQL